jgi:predicted nucleic acid-binding protein
MRSIFEGELKLVLPSNDDFRRATDIMEKYADSKIDFVDCVIVAMAERLNISRILTVDQRDFRILRPKHVSNFEILP